MSTPVPLQEADRVVGGSFFRLRDWLFAIALLGAVFLAYQPAWQGGLLWDDDAHVTKPQLRSLDGLYRIWFDVGATQQYYPLLHSAFWLEYQLWGDATLGYHWVNLFLHGLAALLVALILRKLSLPGAYLAAAIFALHPVQVESVAWITELKNTLSAVFYLTAGLTYLHFDQTRKKWLYAATFVLFVLGLLSKTVTATLPAALLVVFWWQRGRLSWRRDVVPLLPFFAVGAAVGVFTAWVERTLIGAEGEAFNLTWVERCLIAGRAIWFYLGKLLWPGDLMFIYPRWHVSQAVAWQYLFPAAALLLLLVAWGLRRRWRGPLAGLLYFVGTLFPVLGFCNVFPFIYSFVADHFQYLASLGVIALASAGIALLLQRCRLWDRPGGYVLCFGLLAGLGSLTWQQCHTYADIETLFRTAFKVNPECWMAYNNLGTVLSKEGQLDEAIECYETALKIKPDHASANANLGEALARKGKLDEAVLHMRASLDRKSNQPDTQVNLGRILMQQGKLDEAISLFKDALANKPDYANAYCYWGVALQQQGHVDEAIDYYQTALKIKPDLTNAHFNLGGVLMQRGDYDEAVEHFQEVLRHNPKQQQIKQVLNKIRAEEEHAAEAVAAKRALLRTRPNDKNLLNNVAWELATNPFRSIRNGAEAVVLAEKARSLCETPDPAILGTLAAAYAEAERFPEAVKWAREALAIATQQGNLALKKSLEAKLQLFQADTPYRQTPSAPAANEPRR